MNPADWRKDNSGCVFYQNPAAQAFGVGHASFTHSPDGAEDFLVYHGMCGLRSLFGHGSGQLTLYLGMRDPSNGWGARTIRTQKFTWDESTGKPIFPRPGYGPYNVPSGQTQ
jgi:GH43 family beta-xylosidase